jgi:hypothetical protein
MKFRVCEFSDRVYEISRHSYSTVRYLCLIFIPYETTMAGWKRNINISKLCNTQGKVTKQNHLLGIDDSIVNKYFEI